MEKDLKQEKKVEKISIKVGDEVIEYGFAFDTIDEPIGIIANPEDCDQDGDN